MKKVLINITGEKYKKSTIWNAIPESNMNLDFNHPGPDVEPNIPDLWKHQTNLPQPSITQSMVEQAITVYWDEHILDGSTVDFCYNKYENAQEEYDNIIHEREQLTKKSVSTKVIYSSKNNVKEIPRDITRN